MRKAWPAGRQGYLTPQVILVLAATILVVALAFFLNAYFAKGAKNKSISTPSPTPPSTVQSSSPTSDASREPNGSAETANWETFTNSKYKYSFKYRPDLEVGDDVQDSNNPEHSISILV